MKHSTNRWGPVIAFAAAAALILTACSGSGDFDNELTPARAEAMACGEKLENLAEDIDQLNQESAPGKRNGLRDLGLDPNERDKIADVRNRLAERLTLCDEEETEDADAEPSETASPTPSPTASATPSASPDPEESTESPDNEECASTGGVRRWSQLLDHEELKETITSASDEIGFRWSDVRTWASDYEQDCKGARVILVFDKPNLSNESARQRVDAKPDVPVLRVGSCRVVYDGGGCTNKRAVRVILAPLVIEDDAAVGLRSGVGVAVDKNHAIYVYTTQ